MPKGRGFTALADNNLLAAFTKSSKNIMALSISKSFSGIPVSVLG